MVKSGFMSAQVWLHSPWAVGSRISSVIIPRDSSAPRLARPRPRAARGTRGACASCVPDRLPDVRGFAVQAGVGVGGRGSASPRSLVLCRHAWPPLMPSCLVILFSIYRNFLFFHKQFVFHNKLLLLHNFLFIIPSLLFTPLSLLSLLDKFNDLFILLF